MIGAAAIQDTHCNYCRMKQSVRRHSKRSVMFSIQQSTRYAYEEHPILRRHLDIHGRGPNHRPDVRESGAGKSYLTREVCSYFPPCIVREVAGASPTSFFHDHGEWSSEEHVQRVNLERVILLFLDQPHYKLIEKLRPLVSHDRENYSIRSQTKQRAARTEPRTSSSEAIRQSSSQAPRWT